MKDIFREQILCRRAGVREILLRVVCVAACVLLFGTLPFFVLIGDSVFQSGAAGISVFAIVGFLAVYGTWLVFRRTSLEFEYSFINGSFSIDVIYGRTKRKPLDSFEMKQISLIARDDSEKLDRCFQNPNFKVRDYTGHYNERPAYLAVMEGGTEGYLLEPDEEILEALYHYAPAKVYL